ncbi:acetyl/propionyl/methylcrotonyl-CoA carboxylase subunit alpha [Acuticoccus kandeliae]|uniref:acetyl/propionyl/methylcrotonyl-CoA carboxylase subunit alpha n=1 Tax=Acuticoccus kandeliae TaxID=2073160 RepID=UPI000D3E878C|nr:biotin carboxylase N-terminal domain-containing protein [Acuticoccus kandeliae]
MFESVLIANRGEIAVRIMRTAKQLGIRTIAVYSEADKGALHVREADQAILLGPAEARRSYLDKDRLIAAAKEAGAEAIHPGYGFLSENADFAEVCEANDIVFVGPPPAAIRAMGSKSGAKLLMERAGVPVVPGYHGDLQDPAFLKRKAYETGYPVLIKAVSGGGGKGMRRVDKAIDFEEALEAAKREAGASFGDERVLVERYIARPRHVEIQVFADRHGNAVSLHERDCSVQRRHQKVVEEAPAPGMSAVLRAKMGAAAVRAANAVGYVGAGTVEFIVEGGEALSEDRYYFMEMNTRLQVEHPVTEMVMGYDLVEWQFRVAAGELLPLEEEIAPPPSGHAIEVRLYAEDPDQGFLPSAGRIAALRVPDGVRLDSGVETGDTVSPFYDPMMAKLIVHAADREGAIAAMADALDRSVVIGPKTNLAFLRAVITHPEFAIARHDTGFVDRELANLTGGRVSAKAIADAAASLLTPPPAPREGWVDPFDQNDGFRISGEAAAGIAILVDGHERVAHLVAGPGGIVLTVDGHVGEAGSEHVIEAEGDAFAIEAGRAVRVSLVDQLSRVVEDDDAGGHALAPMHGKIVAVYVSPGSVVERDAKLFAIEAMKMEHTVKAGAAARVAAVRFAAGDQVDEGAEVIVLSPLDGEGEAPAAAPPAAAEEAAPAEAEAPVVEEPDAGGADIEAGEPEPDGETEAAIGIAGADSDPVGEDVDPDEPPSYLRGQ